MGDAESKGIGVLNKTGEDINVVMSMSAPHYYENGIKPNQIFYRWPGAVFYTVCVWLRDSDGSNDMTTAKKGLGIFKGIALGFVGAALGIGVVAGSAAVAIPAAVGGVAGGTALVALEVADRRKVRYAEMKGCYAGGTGTWIIAKKDGDRLILVKSDKSTVCKDGTLTVESREYYKSLAT